MGSLENLHQHMVLIRLRVQFFSLTCARPVVVLLLLAWPFFHFFNTDTENIGCFIYAYEGEKSACFQNTSEAPCFV